jgi:psp operon transcriptional activator
MIIRNARFLKKTCITMQFYGWRARLEIELVRRALAEARHNQRRAAERLGLTYHQFRGLYRKHADGLGG